jgi:hypothetical protein
MIPPDSSHPGSFLVACMRSNSLRMHAHTFGEYLQICSLGSCNEVHGTKGFGVGVGHRTAWSSGALAEQMISIGRTAVIGTHSGGYLFTYHGMLMKVVAFTDVL